MFYKILLLIYRLSAAVAAGYYDVINQAYSDNSSAALESDLAGNLSMLDLYTSTGHQVHDMILRLVCMPYYLQSDERICMKQLPSPPPPPPPPPL